MRIDEVNASILGHRVSCIENGYRVTGTVIGFRADEYSVYVRIKFDKPLTCWSGDFCTESWVEEEYESNGRLCDGKGNLEYTTIIDTLDWLKDYRPKSKIFTSAEEVLLIRFNLQLDCLSDKEIQEKRNEVVEFYHNLIIGNTDSERFELLNALNSVTAVIDLVKSERGMEI